MGKLIQFPMDKVFRKRKVEGPKISEEEEQAFDRTLKGNKTKNSTNGRMHTDSSDILLFLLFRRHKQLQLVLYLPSLGRRAG